jgi:adenosylhomocysteine nucleosidase
VESAPNTIFEIAFVCAMPMELDPVVQKLTLRETVIGDMSVHVGSPGGRRVAAIVTGMGPALAASGVADLLDAVEVGWVIVVGITGAVDDDTPIGTLIRPETVVDGSTDTPGGGSEYRPTPFGSQRPAGVMWTTDRLITDPKEIAELRARGVVSLDMETAAIAAECERRAIPWSVFRVISDRATDGSVDEEIFHLSNEDGTPNDAAIERYFNEHPERVEAMARLAEGAVLGAEAAAEAAIAACRFD